MNKSKKPTKKEFLNKVIPQTMSKELKERYIDFLTQGSKIANMMILEYAQNHTIEEVIDFCKKNIGEYEIKTVDNDK